MITTCIISFIIVASIIRCAILLMNHQRYEKPRDNMYFYVARDKNGDLWLYMGKPFRGDTKFYPDIKRKVFCLTYNIDSFGLKHEDFDYLKWEDEPVEVFLNMED